MWRERWRNWAARGKSLRELTKKVEIGPRGIEFSAEWGEAVARDKMSILID